MTLGGRTIAVLHWVTFEEAPSRLNDILRSSGPDGVREAIDRNTRPWDPDAAGGSTPKRMQTRAGPAHRFTNTMDIMSATFAPLIRAVEGYRPEGFSALAGRQKLGKSRMALDISGAIAVTGIAFGSVPCEQGDVLYVALENGERRVQRRIREMYPVGLAMPDLRRLQWAFAAPHIGAGFIEMVEDWYGSAAAPRLIVVDVLQRIKPAIRAANQNSYERDYDCFSGLQSWATGRGVALLGSWN